MAPEVKLVGFEPLGSPSMYNSLQMNQPVVLDTLETFVDGASMKRTGRIPFVIIPLQRISSAS
jgi:threonine dehydratase